MSKKFNVTGACLPQYHYMVDIKERLKKIKALIDEGEYFTINRARQYGKTTTLRALKKYLQGGYLVISLDFQKLGADSFASENIFSLVFARYFLDTLQREESADKEKETVLELEEIVRKEKENFNLFELFLYLSRICEAADKPVVLLIDEVDSAANNQVFLDFLAQLRGYYLDRDETATFWSVILASVYDIRNLKLKIRPEDEHKTNSPWNIAADFDVDMSLSQQGIAGMLEEYEQDHHTGMDIKKIAGLIYDYTSGYPFLVSRLCKLMDERSAKENLAERMGDTECCVCQEKDMAWTKEGILASVRLLLTEENSLFDSLDNKLIDFPELKEMLEDLLLRGRSIEYVPGDVGIRMAVMFGFVRIENGTVVVANRIFETRLYNGFLAEQARHSGISQIAAEEKNQFIVDGRLDMDLVIHKFAAHYTELFGSSNEKFLEDNGRCIFLLYIKPIINGTGNYYIESRTRTNRRTDVIIDFHGQQYIVELKLWRGLEYNQRGEEQLIDYLDAYQLKRGYMVSFNFNKKKQVGVKQIVLGDKVLVEAVV